MKFLAGAFWAIALQAAGTDEVARSWVHVEQQTGIQPAFMSLRCSDELGSITGLQMQTLSLK